ncbi:MAG: MFS transporter [Ignavibacteria bacterium]|nr:MFS transporter [Ignavibacteria bacterium]
MNNKVAYRNPWAIVPTLYFAEGVPYFVVNQISVIFFKDMGVDNTSVTFWTSLLYLPWVIKMFWGPVIDTTLTKRKWIVYTQALMSVTIGGVAFVMHTPQFFLAALVLLLLTAFVSATHDMATDGFYMLALKKDEQSVFAGIRSTFYRAAYFFSTSFLVWLAGTLLISWKAPALAWGLVLAIVAVIFVGLALYHATMLPYPAEDSGKDKEQENTARKSTFWDAFSTYFRQKGIAPIICFILTFRMGEAFLIKLAAPFMKDAQAIGGLGFTTQQVGVIYFFITAAVMSGGIIGGIVTKKHGLKKLLWPMAVIINIPTMIYTLLSFIKPNVILILPFVAIEQFSYGFGFTALTIYMMYIAKGEFKTSHYAISTGISALGMMLPGLVSGLIQSKLAALFPGHGYQYFFILTVLLGIPGIITLFYIPKDFENE